MLDALAEMWSFAFMQRAFLAAFLVGALGSFISFFVVLNRLAFIGAGVSHAAFGGVALGLYAGIDPVLSGGIFATVVSWAIGWVSRKGQIHEDTVIGIFFAGSMALGVAVISMTEGWMADLFSFLFGNILAVTPSDLWILGITGLVVSTFLAAMFKELLTVAFDEEMARADRLPVDALYYGLLTSVAAALIVSVKVVGIILISALIVVPAAIGYELASNFRSMLAVAFVTGIGSSLGGLVLSYFYDIPSGATIVLTASLLFAVAVVVSPRRAPGRAIRRRLRLEPREADG